MLNSETRLKPKPSKLSSDDIDSSLVVALANGSDEESIDQVLSQLREILLRTVNTPEHWAIMSGVSIGLRDRAKRLKCSLAMRSPNYDFLVSLVGSQEITMCEPWPFGVSSDGIGRINIAQKKRTATSVMCELAHGIAPKDKPYAVHCGSKTTDCCVNPNHLYWGTKGDIYRERTNTQTQETADGARPW